MSMTYIYRIQKIFTNQILKELEGKILEVGQRESAEREALKEEFTERLDQKVGDLASEVSDDDDDGDGDGDDDDGDWQGYY